MLLREMLRWSLFVKNKNLEDSNMKPAFNKKEMRENKELKYNDLSKKRKLSNGDSNKKSSELKLKNP